MIKGIIFDLDGVIVFTDKYHYLAWKAIADEENIYFDEVINHKLPPHYKNYLYKYQFYIFCFCIRF